MNPALLDQLNHNGALTHIAQIGGLIALPQFQEFLGCPRASAYRASQALRAARMCSILRHSRGPGLLLLQKSVAAALGSEMPEPPQASKVTPGTVRRGLARAAYFLATGQVAHRMGDLSRRWKTNVTEKRIAVLVDACLLSWKRELRAVHARYQANKSAALRDQFNEIRKRIREPEVILAAGMAALDYYRGLHLVPAGAARAKFLFIENATTAKRFVAVIRTLSTFAAATMIDVHVDFACGSVAAQERLHKLESQTPSRVRVDVLDLQYEPLISGSAPAMRALVGSEISPLLSKIADASNG